MASLMYLEGEILFREYRKSVPKGWHLHHIIPRYKCKQLGIDPNFYENLVALPPEEHVQAHIERWNRLGNEADWNAVKLLDEHIRLPPNPRKGKPGKPCSQETKKKISEAKKGIPLSAETKKKMSESRMGHETSAETRKKLSESRKGRKASDEARKNMSEAGTLAWKKRKARIKWA